MLDPDFLRQVGPATALSVQLVAMTLAGLWVGQELDGKLDSAPWLLLLFTCIGFAIGLYAFILGLGSFEDDDPTTPTNLD
jgi:F0F1-type ATP synthase assembly protein I